MLGRCKLKASLLIRLKYSFILQYKPLDPVLKLSDCTHWLHKGCLEVRCFEDGFRQLAKTTSPSNSNGCKMLILARSAVRL